MSGVRVWDGLAEVPDLAGSVVTIGMFAGMHRGHQEIVDLTRQRARELGLPAVVVTFHPHPIEVHQPGRTFRHLGSLARRLADLGAEGIDGILLLEYTLEFAQLSPEEFVRHYLVEGLRARAVVLGEDARFGRDNAGDVATMAELAERYGFEFALVRDLCDGAGRRWSSTWIREALAAGNVAEAARVLGRLHSVRGEVVHGAKRGRELGYPTANLEPTDIGVVPRDGVYAGWLIDGEERHPAAISVGTNPQFAGVHRSVEAHVLGRWDLDLYGHVVTIEFAHWIRAMEAFESVEVLLERIAADVEEAGQLLGVTPPE